LRANSEKTHKQVVKEARIAGTNSLLRKAKTMPDIKRDIALAFVRVHLLHHANEAPIYGLEMIQELARHGHTLSPGTLYPILHSMEKAGCLKSFSRLEGGRHRKYYEITPSGRETIAELRRYVRELVGETAHEEHTASQDSADSQ
jgi:PadR family transcriptional regulator, regulatory protein PadR